MRKSINERKAWRWTKIIIFINLLGNLGLMIFSQRLSLWAVPFNALTLLCGIFLWYQGYKIGWEYKRLSMEEDSQSD